MQQRTSRHISGFQHEQICTSNQCPRLINYCACPVNHCWISQAKSQTEPHKAISDYMLAHRETLSNCSASCGERPGDSQTTQIKPKFFSACGEESCFDSVRKAAAYASPDRKATNWLSTNQVFVSSYSTWQFPPFVTLNV